MLWPERDFKTFLQNVHFLDNTKDNKSDKGRSLIKYFNQNFSTSVSNRDSKSIDKHMVKFKGRSSIKQKRVCTNI